VTLKTPSFSQVPIGPDGNSTIESRSSTTRSRGTRLSGFGVGLCPEHDGERPSSVARKSDLAVAQRGLCVDAGQRSNAGCPTQRRVIHVLSHADGSMGAWLTLTPLSRSRRRWSSGTLCLGLPEVSVHVDYSRKATRSTAWSFSIRRRSFCLLVAVADPSSKPIPIVRVWADPIDRRALLEVGHPFFASRSGPDRIGVVLSNDTDWDELRDLVTDSYRMFAPKKLIRSLDPPEV
jgi:hypothetical protein